MTIIHSQPVPEPDVNSNMVEGLLQAGYAAEDAGDIAGAIARFRAATAALPSHAESSAALGLAMAQTDDTAGAITALTHAVALDPRRGDLVTTLADLQRGLGQLEDAENTLRAYLHRTPESRSVQEMLAEILGTRHQYEPAVALGRELVLSGPLPDAFLKQFCRWLAHIGAHREAVQHLARHVATHADDATGWLQLGDLWLAVQETQKAAAAWARYRALYPDDPAQTENLLAQHVAQQDASLAPDYVRALFDGYADQFDSNLQEKLRYRAPELLRAAVDRVRSGVVVPCDMLDLGCGTGLGGKYFKPYIGHLTGVDLSPRMLAHAEGTGLYHELAAADIVPWLRQSEKSFDLVLAADVLVYLGDLQPLFIEVRRVLRSGGLFAGTVEHLPAATGMDFSLQPQRRYAHAESYLTRLARTCGFRSEILESCIPRHESGHPVSGLLFVFIADGVMETRA